MTEESKRFCDCDQGRQPCTFKPSVEATDSARLPVVAYVHPLYLKPNALGFEASACRLAAAQVGLCLADDAQARLAEKDARIAQLAAHARGKNKALANALKEIERLRLNIAEYNEHESCWRAEIANLRAQLEQLQAAPAERGVVLPERKDPDTYSRGSPDWHAAHAQNECLDEVARLNPAPATADSDVREVKS